LVLALDSLEVLKITDVTKTFFDQKDFKILNLDEAKFPIKVLKNTTECHNFLLVARNGFAHVQIK